MNHLTRKPLKPLRLIPITALWLASMAVQAQNTMPMASTDSAPKAEMKGNMMESPNMKQSMKAGMDSMNNMKMSGDMDKDFALMMKIHHQQALKMAEMELANGKSTEMKAMATKIISAQKKEIAEFDRWLEKQK